MQQSDFKHETSNPELILCCFIFSKRSFDSFYVNVFDRWLERQLLDRFNCIVSGSAVFAPFPK
ncbi:hypothetical protein ACAW87_16775 [Fibrella sp. GW2-5]